MLNKIYAVDTDPRQFSDPLYPTNIGSFSLVVLALNTSLKEMGLYSEPDQAKWVGISDGLNLNFKYKDKKPFIIHVWDMINVLPNELIEAQKRNNIKIIGLSKQVSELWAKYGIAAEYINIGTDTEFYKQSKPKNEKFTILIDSFTNIRSGFDVNLQAFDLAFRGNKDVQLIIKNTSDSAKLERKIEEYKNRGNNIIYINKRVSFKEMRDLYSGSHILTSVMRHSSWGLSPHMAASCGCLTVVGNFCPSNDMAANLLVNPSREINIKDKAAELVNEWGLHDAYPKNFTYLEEPRFFDYSIEEFSCKLKEIYDNWETYKLIDTRKPIVENWDIKKSAAKLIKALETTF